MKRAEILVDSKVNEIFAKTIVTYKIVNDSSEPLELKIKIYKYLDNILFSSFDAQIGNSIKAKSKVIKTEKTEERYTDSISSGNAAIYTTIDKKDKNIIVHIGNIPPKEELIFNSEFIQFTQSANNSYEFELLRNIPKIMDKYEKKIENSFVKGSLEIKTKSKIKNINKKFLSKSLVIKEEKEDKKTNSYIIKYEENINNITPSYFDSELDTLEQFLLSLEPNYIQTSKLLFELDSNNNLFYQNSLKNKGENSFVLNYKLDEKKNSPSDNKNDKEDIKLNPAIFIFLIDQSGSMSGSPIKVASKALLLFLQSLPVGSYYQIIGFGSDYKMYDNIPKEYNRENIERSIKIVEQLKGDMGGTNIYDPLKRIYNSNNVYKKILLPRNIFLLTDGEIEDKKKTLELIEENSNEFSVYSFGIGNDFDEDLIKNAGIIGKGNYSFCKNIDGLNQVIISNLKDICTLSISNLNLNSNLDKIALYNRNLGLLFAKPNVIYRFKYITKEKPLEKKINFTARYKKNERDFTDNYELEPIELPSGEELSKLIIFNDILKNKSEEEKIQLALKYQIFIEGTSLFAEIELSGKITKPMKLKEIECEKKENKKLSDKKLFNKEKKKKQTNKNNNKLQQDLDDKISEKENILQELDTRVVALENEAKEKLKIGDKKAAKRILKKQKFIIEQIKQNEGEILMMEEQKLMLDSTLQMKDVLCCNQAIKCQNKGMMIDDLEKMKEDNMENVKGNDCEMNEFFKDYDDDDDIDDKLEELEELIGREEGFQPLPPPNKEFLGNNKKSRDEADDLNDFLCCENEKSSKNEFPKEKEVAEKKGTEKDIILNSNNKDDVMIIVNSQDFISGFWDINNKTKNVKNKYEKEFKLLKKLNKIDDIIAMTIIIIYFINKEHKELLDELVLILKKAKIYIQDKAGDSYENIIKKAGIK